MHRNTVIFFSVVFFLVFLMPSLADEQRVVGPFQVAAGVASDGIQAFRLKQEGVAEDVVRVNLELVSAPKAESILLSNTITDIYRLAESNARAAVHRLPEILLSITRTKNGKAESAVEIEYEQCLEFHGERLEFSTSIYNQTKSALDRNHASKYARAYANYLKTYYGLVEQAKQEISDSIMGEYLSCYSAISEN